jgi:hypothetical protein
MGLKRALGLAVAVLLGASCRGDDEVASGEGAGTSGLDPASSSTPDGTSGTSDAGSTGGEGACEGLPSPGQSCTAAQTGERCGYADDCGSYTVECKDGEWVQIAGTGCNAPIVDCPDGREGPSEGEPPDHGDGCEQPGEVCDLDGDCLDVLECMGFNWYSFDVCSEVYCEIMQPVVPGEACEVDDFMRECPGASPCEEYRYHCHAVNGWTSVLAGPGIPDECK